MPVLKKFMCCCQLRTGAVIIGWVGLVMQLFFLASESALIANAHSIFPAHLVAMTRGPLAITLICTIISSLAHISLLWGANSKNRLFLLPWLIYTMIIIVSCFLTILIICIVEIEASAYVVVVRAVMILGPIITGIILYIWLCILSLFQELCKEGDDDMKTADCKPPPYSTLEEPC